MLSEAVTPKQTTQLTERTCELYCTGRFANRKQAMFEAELQLEREKLNREAANRENKKCQTTNIPLPI